MASKPDIINFALSHLGSRFYTDSQIMQGATPANPVGTSGIPGIRQAHLWYDQTKEEVLSAYPWTFATVRKALIPKTLTSAQEPSYTGDWSEIYFYPCNCVQMQYLVDERLDSPSELITNIPYAVEANPDYPAASTEEDSLLLCNIPTPNASAVFTTNDITDERLPARFVQPFSLLLAANIAAAVTESLEAKAAMIRAYMSAFSYYTAQDSQQLHSKDPVESEPTRPQSR